MRRTLLLSLLASLALPASGHAAADLPAGVLAIDEAVSGTVAADRAIRRSCAARPVPGRAGVATRTYRAAADGEVTVRLDGRGDWDLALFDERGDLVGSSAGFGGAEVAQVGLRRGAEILVQACRRSGSRSAGLQTQLVRLDFATLMRDQDKVQRLRVFTPDPADVERLEAAGLDVTHEVGGGTADVLTYGPGDLARLARLGLGYIVEEEDLAAEARRSRAADARITESPLPTGRTTYRQYADYQNELKQWVEQYPDLVKVVPIQSRSFQGREIQAVEIAAPGSDGRPVFTLGAVHHAREWPAGEAAMEFGWDLLKNGASDQALGRVLREVRTVIMPLTNPDGFVLSRRALDPTGNAGGVYSTVTGVVLLGGSFDYKRKNCNPLLPIPQAQAAQLPCEVAFGVDNNRNYSTAWGGGGSSSDPNAQSYRGSGPFSEPETQAVQELGLMTNSPVHMSLHNVAAKVLRPPGLRSQGDTTPDRDALTELGQLVSDATGYTNEPAYGLYDSTGTSKDWGYDALGQFAYTIELGPRNGQFHGSYQVHVIDQYEGAGQYAGRGLREGLIESALYTRRTDQTSRLVGGAPAGATLRIRKTFNTKTSAVCTIGNPTVLNACVRPGPVQEVPETIDMTMTVPEDGEFTWWVNPSTRPFVGAEGLQETYTLTCEVNGITRTTREVLVARGEKKAIDLSGC